MALPSKQSYIGTKHMASAKKSLKSRSFSAKKRPERFVLCVRNEQYPASLELRKLYSVVPDPAASKHDLVRIVDESGEDYLYPADYFIALRLPASVKTAIARAS